MIVWPRGAVRSRTCRAALRYSFRYSDRVPCGTSLSCRRRRCTRLAAVRPVLSIKSLTDVASYPCAQKHCIAASSTSSSSNSLGLAILSSTSRARGHLAITRDISHYRTNIPERDPESSSSSLSGARPRHVGQPEGYTVMGLEQQLEELQAGISAHGSRRTAGPLRGENRGASIELRSRNGR